MDFVAFAFLTITGYLVYILITRKHNYFSKRGIPHHRPTPILGNLGPIVFRKLSPAESLHALYNEFKGEKLIGYFNFLTPLYIVRDVEIIRKITIKDFDIFQDHTTPIDDTMDSLLGNSLMAMKGKNWRDMRSTLSPAFTGSKLRQMFDLIQMSADKLCAHIEREITTKPGHEFEMKEICSKCTINAIATCGFGLDVDTFSEPTHEFFTVSQKISDFTSPLSLIKFLGFVVIPSVMKFFKIQLMDTQIATFFRHLVKTTMANRKANDIFRPDMIQLLMDAKNSKLIHDTAKNNEGSDSFAAVEESSYGTKSIRRVWSDDELTAQILLLFAAGYDTTATALSFTTHELAVNEDIQDKLIDEIDSIEGDFNYNSIQNLKYLDMVISESLRKWPPLAAIERYCWHDYTLQVNDFELKIEKDTSFWIPTYSFHYDEENFPNPTKFDPERFNDENRGKIKPFTYMPFGSGPRNCVGSRFALLQIKIVLATILRKFRLKVSQQTQIPLQLSKTAMTMTAENGIWITFEPRNK